jgi:hypothetical protein
MPPSSFLKVAGFHVTLRGRFCPTHDTLSPKAGNYPQLVASFSVADWEGLRTTAFREVRFPLGVPNATNNRISTAPDANLEVVSPSPAALTSAKQWTHASWTCQRGSFVERGLDLGHTGRRESVRRGGAFLSTDDLP